MKSRIGYNFGKGDNGSFKTFNALQNEENEWTFYNATETEVDDAVELADQAWKDFRNSSLVDRGTLLRKIAVGLNDNRVELTTIYCQESNLSNERAQGELNRTITQLNLMADFIQTDIFLDEQPFNVYGGKSLKRAWLGIGPVAVFGASNFPFAYSTVGGDTVAALAAGCPVIVKAHPYHAGTSYKVSEIVVAVLKELNFAPGIFSHLLDEGFAVGAQLVAHPLIKAVGFTGSIKGGEALIKLGVNRVNPIPVFAEMGSINPIVIMESALEQADKWVKNIAASISTDAGQFCTKPGLILLPDNEDGHGFAKHLKGELLQIEPKVFVHPNGYNGFKSRIEQHFEWINAPKWHAQPNVHEVDLEDWLKEESLREEFFGPQSIVLFYNEDNLKTILGQLKGQLTFTILGSLKDPLINLVEEFALNIAGRLVLNDVPTGVTVAREMVHGGTYPAASDARYTAVGPTSIYRFLRPIVKQNWH